MIDTRDITPLRRFWTDATVERFPRRTCQGAGAFNARSRLPSRIRRR